MTRWATAPAAIFYWIVTAALFANFVGARIAAVGGAELQKVILLGAGVIGGALLCSRFLDSLKEHKALLAVVRYGPWCLVCGVAVYHEHYSLVPRLALLVFLAGMVVLDSFVHARWLAGPSISVFGFLGALALADVLQQRIPPPMAVEWMRGTCIERDPLLGYRLAPTCTTQVRGKHEDVVIYDAVYTTDEFGRRVVIDEDDAGAERHAVFMGGSFVFGDGVNDGETLPSQFAAVTRGYTVYNYGVSGYGAQHMYALLHSGRLRQEVPEAAGFMVYCMFPEHIDRAAGTYLTMRWGKWFPRYVLLEERITHTGSFEESQPVRTRVYDLIRCSPTLDRAGLWAAAFMSARLSPDFLVALVEHSDAEYSRQFGGTFYVYVWPNRDPRTSRFVEAARSIGLRVIELESLGVPLPGPWYEIPYDGHPKGSYYRLAAGAIARSIGTEATEAAGDSPGMAAHQNGPENPYGTPTPRYLDSVR
jgi:hypothetical protein